MDRTPGGGGAFDVLRTYGNLSALQRNMLGWREDKRSTGRMKKDGALASTRQADDVHKMVGGSGGPQGLQGRLWLEAQCGGLLVTNENLHNLIPSLPIILGAGGLATDYEGNELIHRQLSQGRCNVLYSANTELHGSLMGLIRSAKKSLD